MAWLLLVLAVVTGTASAAPSIVSASAQIDKTYITHGGGEEERWFVLRLQLEFSEDLYVDYNGALTRIDRLPVTPSNQGYGHYGGMLHPTYAYPLNQVLGGAFAIEAPNAACTGWHGGWTGGDPHRGIPEGKSLMMLGKQGLADRDISVVTGMPDWDGLGGTNHAEANLPDPGFASADGGCAGKDDFVPCPEWVANNFCMEGEDHSVHPPVYRDMVPGCTVWERWYGCLSGQCYSSRRPIGPTSGYAMVLPSTSDGGLFDVRRARLDPARARTPEPCG